MTPMIETRAHDSAITDLKATVEAVGLRMIKPWIWTAGTGDMFDIPVLISKGNDGMLWHQWRVCLRAQVLHGLGQRRPVFGDANMVCQKKTLQLHKSLDAPRDRGVFRVMAMDALLSAERYHRDEANQVESVAPRSRSSTSCGNALCGQDGGHFMLIYVPPTSLLTRRCGLLVGDALWAMLVIWTRGCRSRFMRSAGSV